MVVTARSVGRGRGRVPASNDPSGYLRAYQPYTGFDVPDIMEFVMSDKYLDSGSIYPRQGTFLKLIFLAEDLFTDYDYEVISEWTETMKETGDEGCQPDVLDRMHILKAQKYDYFHEVLAVIGRRGGKGHIGALAGAYITWKFLARGDPQGHYGIDRDKKLTAMVFAAKKGQAKENQWRDLINVIMRAPCFAKYISQSQSERLSVRAPYDQHRKNLLIERGIVSDLDIATFEILPKESTPTGGRGPASFLQLYDEMAHVVASGANRSAEEIYTAAKPSLDQFGKDGFIYEPSSPWQMTGQFYTNYLHSFELEEDGSPVYPEMLTLQLPSWSIYVDWERAHNIPVYPPDYIETEYARSRPNFRAQFNPPQLYDEQMQREERANPEKFAVERRAKFAAAQNAYLSPKKIAGIWEPWQGRKLVMQDKGVLIRRYKAHGDPAQSNANFGWAIAHAERGDDGELHVVFDVIHAWKSEDYEDNQINYVDIENDIFDYIDKFKIDETTLDQWNSAGLIDHLRYRVQKERWPKQVNIFEKTATAPYNWKRAETFKTAIGMGWVHAPYFELADLELRFLQESNGKVDKQNVGPVQTKDVADCLMECVMTLLGEQVNAFNARSLGDLAPSGMLSAGGLGHGAGVRSNAAFRPGQQAAEEVGIEGFGRMRGSQRQRRAMATPSRGRRFTR